MITNSGEHVMRVTCGRLLCGPMRNYLQEQTLINPAIRFVESGGWIERTFTVVGSHYELSRLMGVLRAWAKSMDELV